MRFAAKILIFSAALSFSAKAQNPVHRHSVGIGFERVGLDAPDHIGNRYLVGYARHLLKDRVVVGANLGYMSVLNAHFVDRNMYVYGKRRKRVTSDLTASFDFIRHPRHAFRIGAGPSLWYRNDEPLGSLRYTLNLTTGEVTNVRATWGRPVKEVNFGYNVLVEYEYALTQQVLVSGKMKFFSSREAGQSTIYGFGLGYRLQ